MPRSHTIPSVVLKKNGIRASKKLGQNFLNNIEVVEKIIKAARSVENEFILEIGPG
ncbi:MAG: 16S rRNA (adenine(1518)-N(6)/adenine(1519)-N(6))-dimethyltransferase, partial [Rickettsiales bacterium]|nr:16S rRNA (adenine(1518)-N(6)/adenine(1519)-N(6))-dimethyltransferase [Rickettsiales bacterium]